MTVLRQTTIPFTMLLPGSLNVAGVFEPGGEARGLAAMALQIAGEHGAPLFTEEHVARARAAGLRELADALASVVVQR